MFELLKKYTEDPTIIGEIKKSPELMARAEVEAETYLASRGSIEVFGQGHMPAALERSETKICKNCEKDIKKEDEKLKRPTTRPIFVVSYSFYKSAHIKVVVEKGAVCTKTDVPALTLT